MKKNNRGFLLAESLVVSTFVLTVLILLYIQFNNLTTNYKNSYNYNNVESIYDLSSVSDYLLTNNYNLSDQLTESKPYVIVYKDGSCNMDAGIIDSFCDNLISQMDAKTVIYTSSDISIIQKYVSENDDSNINQSLREFISRVETNTVQNKGRLFAEFNNGTFATIAMDGETYIEEPPIEPNPSSNIMQSWSLNSSTDFHNNSYRNKIISVEVLNDKNVPANAIASWDVSEAKDGSVMAWIINDINNNGYYNLYIGGDGGVTAGSSLANMFFSFSALQNVELKNLNTSNVTNMDFMFARSTNLISLDLNGFDTSKVESMVAVFEYCSNLVTVNLNQWDTSNVTNIQQMFRQCSSLQNIDVSNWNTSKVEIMCFIFIGCSSLTNLDLSGWDTSNAYNMDNMFQGCSSLKTITFGEKWNTSKADSLTFMFRSCSSLTSLDLSNWNTSNVTDMRGMFSGCSSLTSLDLSYFDTSKVTSMLSMFENASNLKAIYVGPNWTTANANTTAMFTGCGVSSVTRK